MISNLCLDCCLHLCSCDIVCESFRFVHFFGFDFLLSNVCYPLPFVTKPTQASSDVNSDTVETSNKGPLIMSSKALISIQNDVYSLEIPIDCACWFIKCFKFQIVEICIKC